MPSSTFIRIGTQALLCRNDSRYRHQECVRASPGVMTVLRYLASSKRTEVTGRRSEKFGFERPSQAVWRKSRRKGAV